MRRRCKQEAEQGTGSLLPLTWFLCLAEGRKASSGTRGRQRGKGVILETQDGVKGHPAEPSLTHSHAPGSCLSPEPPAVCSSVSGEWLRPELCADQPPPALGGHHRRFRGALRSQPAGSDCALTLPFFSTHSFPSLSLHLTTTLHFL